MRNAAAAVAAAALLLLALGAPAATAASPPPLVRYHATQAIRGGDWGLLVRKDGAAVARHMANRKPFTLTATRLRGLRRLVRRANFATLSPRYARPEGPPITGGRTETVRAAGKKVVVEPGAEIPARLDRLLARLRKIFSAHDPGL
jgi:hypothetical protein